MPDRQETTPSQTLISDPAAQCIRGCTMSDIAKLDPALVRKIVKGFPASPDWQSLNCAELVQSARAKKLKTRDWSALDHCKGKGGVYAFIFPAHLFSAPRRIELDSPNKQTITFEFSNHPELLLPDGRMVVYIGRSANLLKRIQGHFGLAKKTTLGQVQYGLYKSGLCNDRAETVRFMLKHATLAYTILDGPINVANRDVIEVALWAKYMTPFNIKSEH